MGQREGIVRELELEGPLTTPPPPNDNDDDDDKDPESAKFNNTARRDWLEALQARHLADEKSLGVRR